MKRTTPATTGVVVFVLFAFVFAVVVGLANGQKCKTFINDTSLGYGLCANYVDYKYYLPQGPTEWIVTALLYGQANNATSRATLVPGSCEKKLIPYICGSIFQGCKEIDGEAVAVPICKSICEDVIDACATIMEANNQPLPNCSALPSHKTVVTLSNGTTRTVQCQDMDNTQPHPRFPWECGGPFAYDPSQEEIIGFPCGIRCPAPLYPEDLTLVMNWILNIAAPITLFLGLVVLGLQIYQKSWFLKFPRRYVPIHGIFLILNVVSQIIIIGKGGYEAIGCASDAQTVNGNTAAAIAQTWLLYYGTWGAAIGFTIIATNVLLVRVVSLLGYEEGWLESHAIYFDMFYAFWLLVPPTIILVVLQSLLYVGYCSGLGSCFFKTQIPLGSIRDVLDLFLLVLPFSVAQIWAYLCLLTVLFLTWKTKGYDHLVKQAPLFLYLLFYAISYVMSLVGPYEVLIYGIQKSSDYITCLITNWIATLFSKYAEQEDCGSGGPIDYYSWVFQGPIIGPLELLLWVIFFGYQSFIFALQKSRMMKTRERAAKECDKQSLT